MPTYQQQFNKLTEAYIKNEVDPMKQCACFIGNLLNKTGNWAIGRTWEDSSAWRAKYWAEFISKAQESISAESEGLYTTEDIVLMENTFLNTYTKDETIGGNEDTLFEAFEVTLDVLKEIHRSKGEDVDNQFTPSFQKRQLV